MVEAKQIQIVRDMLATSRKIVVVAHRNPDGDALGSSLGLYFYLKNLGHQVTVIMPNDFPDFLKWLPGSDEVVIYEKDKTHGNSLIQDAEIIFTLDFNTFSRVGEMQEALSASSAEFIMIDHHQQPDDYAVVTYSDVTMSSTCEMTYHFIKAIDPEAKITEEIATNLYTGIMTDTGSFRFPSTSPATHRVTADLIEVGAKNGIIHQNVFDTHTQDRMRLLGRALENMTILPEYKTAYITLTQKELDDHNFKKGDTEGFVNYGLAIGGIVMAAIFIENKQENITKISFRSKGEFSVNEFARNHFNGGGHTNAAGGRSDLSLDETVSEFISILPQYKDKITHAL